MNSETTLLTIISILLAVVGYFVKKTLDKTERISDDVSDIKPKVDILWKDRVAPANSPRQLNDKGQKILSESGIKEIIDSKKEKLVSLVKLKKPTNAYDAESVITQIVSDIPVHYPDITDRLKQGAFNVGTDINTILFVGSIYLRNITFPDLGFKIDDLD